MARLNTTIHVYDGADVIVYGPGDEVLPQHREQITAPGVWEDEPGDEQQSSTTSSESDAGQSGANDATGDAGDSGSDGDDQSGDDSAAEAQAGDGAGDSGSDGDDQSAAPEIPIPPKGGAGSGKAAWADYAHKAIAARGLQIDIPADATRDDIIAALDDAKIPTE